MPQQINDALSNADASPQGIDGGLNLKADPTRLAPPVTTRSDNAHYDGIGNVTQLPGLVSTGLNGAKHVYNLHARDTYQPTSSGDVMVHGEFADGTLGYTTSAWAHANGTVVNSTQPVLPFTVRTKAAAANMAPSGIGTLDAHVMTFARQEVVGADGQRAYAAIFTASGYCVTGKVNGFTETNVNLTGLRDTNAISGTATDIIGVQGTSYFATAQAVSSPANQITIRLYDFNQNLITTKNISGAITSFTDGHFPFQLFNHAGVTFLAFFSSTTGYLNFFDINAGNYYGTTIGSSGNYTAPFGIFSPYTHTSIPGFSFLGVLFQNKVFIYSRQGSNAFNLVGTSGTLPQPGNVPSNSTLPLQGTASMLINDSQGGIGGGASFLITVFRNYPESFPNFDPGARYLNQNSLAVDQLTFTANANPASTGTITYQTTNVARFPGGMTIQSRAFEAFPNAAGGAGISAAKQSLCMVRSAGWEPGQGTYTYGQPTYYVIDHAARVVTRFADGQAHIANTKSSADNNTTQSNLPIPDSRMQCLAQPLILNAADSGSDLSAMSITLPGMFLVSASLPPPIQVSANVVTTSTQPIVPFYVPYFTTLSLPANNASVPAAQAGAYTILSGPLTCIHDGGQVVEAGYHQNTPNIFVVPTSSGQTLGTAGTYYYIAYLEWVDDLGQYHRSRPCNPVPVTVTGTFYGAVVYCPFPPTARRTGFVANTINLKVFRSIQNRLNDTNYYYVGSNTIPGGGASGMPANYLGGQDFYRLDATATTTASPYPSSANAINAQPRVYTAITANSTGNIYPATPPPPFVWQVAHRGRVFGLAQTLGKFYIYYSSPTSSSVAPEWNTFNFQPVPADIGDARSIESVDAFLYVFGSRYNAFMTGDGPAIGNAVGSPSPGDGYSVLAPVPTPAGVIGSGSPARVPTGLVFQGFSGIQLLGRDQSISPIGMAVDPLTGRQVGNPGQIYGRGVTLPSLQSVVWPCANGPALVFSYLTNKFSTWPLLSNACTLAQRIDGTIITALQPISGGTFAGPASVSAAGCDIGTLQNAAYAPTYVASATAPALVIETPWILPHGTSGAEARVWNGCLTGTWQGPHILQIEQAYDYEPYSLTRTVDFSTAPRRYQVITQPRANTRCVAIRFRFSLLPSVSLGSSYLMATLSDFVLFSGQQQGTTRTSANLRS